MTVYSFADEDGNVREKRTITPAPGSFPASSGDGPPVADPATLAPGTAYVDNTNGALYMVVSFEGDKFWVLGFGEISANSDFEGIVIGNGVSILGRSLAGLQVTFTDVDAASDTGSGNGVRWNGTGVDGEQSLSIRVGAIGLHRDAIFFSDGSFETQGPIYADQGFGFPAADPHIAGVWWDDAGTLTKSSG